MAGPTPPTLDLVTYSPVSARSSCPTEPDRTRGASDPLGHPLAVSRIVAGSPDARGPVGHDLVSDFAERLESVAGTRAAWADDPGHQEHDEGQGGHEGLQR